MLGLSLACVRLPIFSRSPATTYLIDSAISYVKSVLTDTTREQGFQCHRYLVFVSPFHPFTLSLFPSFTFHFSLFTLFVRLAIASASSSTSTGFGR